MYIDGHFAQWALDGETAETTAQNALKEFVSLLGKGDAVRPKKKRGAEPKRNKL